MVRLLLLNSTSYQVFEYSISYTIGLGVGYRLDRYDGLLVSVDSLNRRKSLVLLELFGLALLPTIKLIPLDLDQKQDSVFVYLPQKSTFDIEIHFLRDLLDN